MTFQTASLRALALTTLLLALSACGLVSEKEAPAPVARLAQPAAAECALPALEELEKPDKLLGGVDCLERQLESAFERVRGKSYGELSLAELQTLQREGLLKVKLSENEWQAVGGALSLFHPEGEQRLSRKTALALLSWVRTHGPRALEYTRIKLEAWTWPQFNDVLSMLEELTALISLEGRFSLRQAKALASSIDSRADPAQLEAIWRLKGLLFETSESRRWDSDFEARSLRKLLKIAIESARAAPLTFQWALTDLHPAHFPKGIETEWRAALSQVREYFSSPELHSYSTDQLRFAFSSLSSTDDGTTGLLPDVVRVAEKLSGEPRAGLRVAPLLPLLDDVDELAKGFREAASAFDCMSKPSDECEVSARQVLRGPLENTLMSRIALKGRLSYPRVYDAERPEIRPLDGTLSWQETMVRLLERAAITRIFDAFDSNRDGRIPFATGTSSKEAQEAMDLAFTFLRFISADATRKDREGHEIPAAPILVKPGSLYGLIGLIGDEWLPDGNTDGALNAEEFYGVLKVYEDIQDRKRWATPWWGTVKRYKSDPNVSVYKLPGEPYFSRREFIENFHMGLTYEPFSYPILTSLAPQTRESLLHALLGVSEEPIEVYEDLYDPTRPPTKVTLTQYADSESSLAPVALLSMLERLLMKCDLDEDSRFNWLELDCAMPLLLKASHLVVTSELVELDPGVHDGSRMLLEFLNSSGLPRSVAKLIAINGSFRTFELPRGLSDWLNGSAHADWDQLATFIGAPADLPAGSPGKKLWIAEAMSRYGHCDVNEDGRLQGSELDCFVGSVLDQTQAFLERLAPDHFTSGAGRAFLQHVRESRVVSLAIKLATQDQKLIDRELGSVPTFSSTPVKILQVIEEAIRRGKPLCKLPSC
ncbi:MAG: hypothetical protein NDJ90_12290 [Oligoflexia bacterium]|nr:hypothetical protein [Oligoflexia bacterium]